MQDTRGAGHFLRCSRQKKERSWFEDGVHGGEGGGGACVPAGGRSEDYTKAQDRKR